MYFRINYSEGGNTYTLYSASRKDAETVILQLLAEGYRDVRLLARPKRGDALARLVLARPRSEADIAPTLLAQDSAP